MCTMSRNLTVNLYVGQKPIPLPLLAQETAEVWCHVTMVAKFLDEFCNSDGKQQKNSSNVFKIGKKNHAFLYIS